MSPLRDYNENMKTGVISLTTKQFSKLDIINKAVAGFITVREAAERLSISKRQVQRIKKEVRENGPAGLIHKNTHRTPTHAIPEKTKEKILMIRERPGYRDSNFSHFQELLATKNQIIISYSALYRLLKEANIKSPKTRRRFKPHRRRKRRPQAGSLIQIDASPHDWLSIGAYLALHGAIDDATGQITGLYLCKNECMLGHHEVIRRTINVFGTPEAAYADRHTIFRSPNADKAKAIDAPPGIKAHETQFGRALSELGIQLITARSPQAKGRIERLWGTLQSRLPVEFAVNEIKDIDSANNFLRNYIFAFNSEFAVEPQDCDNAFLPLKDGLILDHVLCVKEQRTLDNGQVFSYNGKRFQIEKSPYSAWIPPKAKVTVMVSPYIGIKACYLNYVFETKPATVKKSVVKEIVLSKETKEPRIHRPENPWVPQTGLPWKPGLPTYRETLEIVSDIFNKPYANAKRNKSSVVANEYVSQ
jgi:transposase